MVAHLVDGTYELFRHFYGLRRFNKGEDPPFGAVVGVLHTVLQMIEKGATHVGVATDHVIESFRNDLWPGYKTGEGIEPALLAQFHPLEDALAAMGVAVWPMVELEADDALASAAHLAARRRACREGLHLDARQGPRAVRARRPRGAGRPPRATRSATQTACARSSASSRRCIPDLLALVGDAADGYPGIAGIGEVDRGAAHQPLRRDRGLPAGGPAASGASSRCCSSVWRRCEPTRRCSATSRRCAGAARPRASQHGPRRIGDARLLARSRRMVDSVH